MNTYKTTEIANIIGIHPNTVRLYEKLDMALEKMTNRLIKLTLRLNSQLPER